MTSSSNTTWNKDTSYYLYISMNYFVPRNGKFKISVPPQIYVDDTNGMPDVRLLKGINGTARVDVSNV